MYMGGVDQADQKRKAYSCSRKSEKWWYRLFWFLLDISIVNAHILSTLTPGFRMLSQKNFRIELGTSLLETFQWQKANVVESKFCADAMPSPTSSYKEATSLSQMWFAGKKKDGTL